MYTNIFTICLSLQNSDFKIQNFCCLVLLKVGSRKLETLRCLININFRDGVEMFYTQKLKFQTVASSIFSAI